MTETDLLAIDEDSRRRALEVASFIVEAPAGAGKTELLTQRYLRLLAIVDEPEEIVAITFTNKAAAEMRARILGSLRAAAEPVECSASSLLAHKRITRELALAALARDAERGWEVLRNPSRLRITTIDALSASLARQMPFLSRFGAQPAVTDKPAAHYETAAQRTLALLESDESALADASDTVAAALRYFHNDAMRLQQLIVAMLERRDQWLGHVGVIESPLPQAIGQLVSSDLARVARHVDDVLQRALMPVARYAASNLAATGSTLPIVHLEQWKERLDGGLHELQRWRGIAALLLTKEGTLRRRFDKNMGLPADKEAKPHKEAISDCCAQLTQLAGAEAALGRLLKLPAPQLDIEEAEIVAVFTRLLKLAAAQLWSVFQQHREVDFIEIAQRALVALGDADAPSNLQLRLDYRIRHLLVDEFQDTSPAQIALLERLMAGWQPDDGRTLFVVGDPMQSIYRFRKADVGLFLQVRAVGIGGIALDALRLNRNNRSHPEIVEWINAAFPGIFPAADHPQSGAVKYASSVATKPSLGDKDLGVIMHPVIVDHDDEEGDLIEARKVIDIVRRARAHDAKGSIAILVRARSHLAALVAELRRAAPDIHYQAIEIETLADRQVVQDLLALTRALHHRADRLNWLAVLRAPWCGLTLADMHALVADDHRTTVWQLMQDDERLARLSDAGRARLLHVRDVMRQVLAQQGRIRTRRWIEGAWRMLGGGACLRNAAERADADTYLRLLDRIDASDGFTLARLDAELDSLYAHAEPAQHGVVPIQIMTVHKSKGLEFDTVILPGLHRVVTGNDPSLLLWEQFVDEQSREHLVVAPMRRRGAKNDDALPSAYDYLRLLECEREENEARRVLYVAATRAIRALHLLGVATVKRSEEGNAAGNELKPPRKGSALCALWPVVETTFMEAAYRSTPSSSTDGTASTLADFAPKLVRLARPDIPSPFREALPSTTALRRADAEPRDDSLAALADTGTLVHRMLELIAQDGLDAWNAARLDAMQPMFRRWLEARGHAAAELDAGVAFVHDAVRKGIESDTGRWILRARDGAGNELALTAQREGLVQASVVDRTFVENGERWIIDYKTVRFASEPTAADFMTKAERFRPQLERYAALFAGDGLPVRIAIYFAAHGHLAELAMLPQAALLG